MRLRIPPRSRKIPCLPIFFAGTERSSHEECCSSGWLEDSPALAYGEGRDTGPIRLPSPKLGHHEPSRHDLTAPPSHFMITALRSSSKFCGAQTPGTQTRGRVFP